MEERAGKRNRLYTESQILINKIISSNTFGIFGFFVYGMCSAYSDVFCNDETYFINIHVCVT